MGAQLKDIEQGASFVGDYHAELSALQEKLGRLQLAQVVHGARSIILFEGWEGAGKRAALKRLTGSWDSCYFATHCIRSSRFDDSDRHWLAPYWATLPRARHTSIYFRSWYRRLVDGRAVGELADQEWHRAFDEINEFEAQQADHGTILIKLFFHVSADVQYQRLHERGEHLWRKWTIRPEDLRNHQAHEGYLAAWQEMFDQSDTRWAPWRVVDGSDKRSSRLQALRLVAEMLEAALPPEPPPEDDQLVVLAREKYA